MSGVDLHLMRMASGWRGAEPELGRSSVAIEAVAPASASNLLWPMGLRQRRCRALRYLPHLVMVNAVGEYRRRRVDAAATPKIREPTAGLFDQNNKRGVIPR